MRNSKGVTLIELLIVIAIIGILAAIGTPAYIGQQLKAARSEAFTELESLRLLEEVFFSENNVYTGNLGVAGNTRAIRDANFDAIRVNLPAFQPDNDANFSYMILADEDINGTVLVPCFHARATGVDGTRVDGDIFDIDCNNNTNY